MGNKTFIGLEEFRSAYNQAATLFGSRHRIKEDNMVLRQGRINNVYNVKVFSNRVTMRITCQHVINPKNELFGINEISISYSFDNTHESNLHFLFCIGEIAMATGAIQSVSELSSFVTDIGLRGDCGKKNTSGNIEIRGIKYGYFYVKKRAEYIFYVSKE